MRRRIVKRFWLWTLGLAVVAFLGATILPGVMFLLFHTDEVEVTHLFVSNESEVIGRLELSDSYGVVVWALDNPKRLPLRVIDYGVTPAGWEQRVPRNHPPRRLIQNERLALTLNFPPEGWARIGTRPTRDGKFLHGLTASGSGCDRPECAEIFQLRSRPPAERAVTPGAARSLRLSESYTSSRRGPRA